jgi:hypothetical protein
MQTPHTVLISVYKASQTSDLDIWKPRNTRNTAGSGYGPILDRCPCVQRRKLKVAEPDVAYALLVCVLLVSPALIQPISGDVHETLYSTLNVQGKVMLPRFCALLARSANCSRFSPIPAGHSLASYHGPRHAI